MIMENVKRAHFLRRVFIKRIELNIYLSAIRHEVWINLTRMSHRPSPPTSRRFSSCAARILWDVGGNRLYSRPISCASRNDEMTAVFAGRSPSSAFLPSSVFFAPRAAIFDLVRKTTTTTPCRMRTTQCQKQPLNSDSDAALEVEGHPRPLGLRGEGGVEGETCLALTHSLATAPREGRSAGHFTPRTSFDDVVGLGHFSTARRRRIPRQSTRQDILKESKTPLVKMELTPVEDRSP